MAAIGTKIPQRISKLGLRAGYCQNSISIQDQGRTNSRGHFHVLDAPVPSEGGGGTETNVSEEGGKKRKWLNDTQQRRYSKG